MISDIGAKFGSFGISPNIEKDQPTTNYLKPCSDASILDNRWRRRGSRVFFEANFDLLRRSDWD